MSKLLTRNFFVELEAPEELRAEGEEKRAVIIGRPILYNSETIIGGKFIEVIREHAFDNCDLDDVLLCYNHDISKIPLARSRRNNGNSSMKITVDEKGLLIEAELDIDNNAEARTIYNAVKRGDLNGMSLRMVVAKEAWSDPNTEGDYYKREILEVSRIREMSIVNFAAYKSTSVEVVRDEVSEDEALRELENSRNLLENEDEAVETEENRSEDLSNQIKIEELKRQIKALIMN